MAGKGRTYTTAKRTIEPGLNRLIRNTSEFRDSPGKHIDSDAC